MSKLPYLRKKSAKGRDYYYFDAGKGDGGQRILTPLPHIRDPRFGDCYARAKAARTNRSNRQGILTFEGLVRMYEKSPEFHALAENSKRSYSRYLAVADKLFRNGAGDSFPVHKIEREEVLALRLKLSGKTGVANQAIRSVAAMFAWAVENGKAKKNPAHGVKKFKAKPHLKWPQELIEEALADPQIGMAVALFYFTGQRINEIVKMSWRDIQGDYMEVYAQKQKRHIRVAILPELAEMLKAQERKSVAILTNIYGRPWTTGGLRDKLQDWASARGHHVVPHGLRKNAVESLLKAGCTVAEVQGITDQTMPTIQHYARDVDRLALGRAAIVKFDAARRAKNK